MLDASLLNEYDLSICVCYLDLVRDIYTIENVFLLRESTQNLARNDVLLAYYIEALRQQSQTIEQFNMCEYNLLDCNIYEKSYIIYAI